MESMRCSRIGAQQYQKTVDVLSFGCRFLEVLLLLTKYSYFDNETSSDKKTFRTEGHCIGICKNLHKLRFSSSVHAASSHLEFDQRRLTTIDCRPSKKLQRRVRFKPARLHFPFFSADSGKPVWSCL
ncbi:hypothetical protein BgiMline_030194 [Biomphalaria glabrata]